MTTPNSTTDSTTDSTHDSTHQPVDESQRIQSLDVIRGFALLGILLLNIVGMGLYSSSYLSPGADIAAGEYLNVGVWATVEIGFEGAMRGLFSMLFGAGIVLLTGAKERGPRLFYSRHFWLLGFGLVNCYLLMWNGDILVTYALAGALLYFLRKVSARNLLITATALFFALMAFNGASQFGLSQARQEAERSQQADYTPTPQSAALIDAWADFEADFLDNSGVAEELERRRESYASAFTWTAEHNLETFIVLIPAILIWDALLMMMIGMALFKLQVLNGGRSPNFYKRLMVGGFAVGLLTNGWEVFNAFSSGFDPLASFSFIYWSYDLGRLGMALGWMGLVMLACTSGWFTKLRTRLAAVGRMALTNYLMHSFIAMILFTGAGFSLVAKLERWELYIIVFAIWAFQLIVSPWWLNRFHFGPCEWLWRALTYGKLPAMAKH